MVQHRLFQVGKVIRKGLNIFFRQSTFKSGHVGTGVMGFGILNLLHNIITGPLSTHVRKVGTTGAAIAVDGMTFDALAVVEQL